MPESYLKLLSAYFELAKPRITLLLMVIALTCYFLGAGGTANWLGAIVTLGSVGLSSVGIFALNHYMEHPKDALMIRTRQRPIPSGKIPPLAALVFGLGFLFLSLVFCWFAANPLTALVSALVAVGYLLVYTPLKYKTILHTALGALPGAAPPLAGWAVATGTLPPQAWVVFLFMFLWQFPHFLAIEALYRQDYERVQAKVVPVVDKTGFHLSWQILGGTLLLFPTLGAAWWLGLSRPLGASLGTAATIVFLVLGWRLIRNSSPKNAKILVKASVFYLPLVLGLFFLPW